MANDINIMEDLLQKNPLDLPVVGEDIQGKVLDIGTNAMYVDLGPIGTGVVLGEELHDGFGTIKTLKKGDEVTATVLTTNTTDGYIELSLRQASEDKVWEDLFAKQAAEEPVDVKIIDANKGGLLISINGISGFLPVSQLAYDHYPRVDGGDKTKILGRLKEYTGEIFRVAIINVNREENKLIVSEKAARKSEELNLVNSYEKGDTVDGEVTGVVDFGVFVKFGKNGQKLEGLVHISELSWQLVENPRDLYKEGDKVQAKVIEIVNGKVSLSIKALTEDPWNTIAEKFSAEQVVEGQVARMNHFGIFVQLDAEVRGLVHNSEIEKDRPKYTELKEGTTAQFKILSVDPQEHRISLALA
jgi:small subunit ribosomal protein S1